MVRTHLKAQQFSRSELPHHKLYYVTQNAVQGGRPSFERRGENERKAVSLNVPPPPPKVFKNVFISPFYPPSGVKPPLSQKGKRKLKRYFVSKMKSFTVTHPVVTAPGTARLYLCLCAGKGNCSRNGFTIE